MKSHKGIKLFAGLLGALALCTSAYAGTYKTITVDGDFSDWDDVPVLTTTTTAVGDPVDFVSLSVANDGDNLYLRVVYASEVAVNGEAGTAIYIAIDTDNDVNTGFNVYGLNLVGSEVGWVNDTGFQQATGVFNTGVTLNDGQASIALYGTTVTQQEMSISLSATYANDSSPVFPNGTIAIAFYTSGATTDSVLGKGVYTFAIPEPGHYAIALSALLGAGLLFRRRRRRS